MRRSVYRKRDTRDFRVKPDDAELLQVVLRNKIQLKIFYGHLWKRTGTERKFMDSLVFLRFLSVCFFFVLILHLDQTPSGTTGTPIFYFLAQNPAKASEFSIFQPIFM